MAKKKYIPPSIEVGEMEQRKGNAHLRLPFGLCKKYGISLPPDATPRDAWNALKGIGIQPGEEYDKFFDDKDKGSKDNGQDATPNVPTDRIDKIFSDTKDRFTYDGTFTKEYAKAQYEAGDDYHKELVADALESTGITYRHGKSDECYSYMGRVILTVDEEYGSEKNSYEKGEVFYHETFHAIDGGYATRWGTMLSHTYTNEEGKTLYDVLKSEKRKFGAAGIAEVKAARDKDVEEILIAKNITTRERIDATMNNWKQQQERLNSFSDWQSRREVSESEEFKKANIAYNTLKAQRMVYNQYANRKYGFISDILSQWNESIGIGHSTSYWKKDKYNSSSEFFAEVGACGATNNAALEVVRKYFPKSVEFAEKLIDDIKTGKIKAR
jgi:hypothetical protein